jgi:hypothetical protein
MRTLSLWGSSLAYALSTVAKKRGDGDSRSDGLDLAAALARGEENHPYSTSDIDLIEEAMSSGGVPPLSVELPSDLGGLLTREELRARLEQWIDGLPDQPALIEFRPPNLENSG